MIRPAIRSRLRRLDLPLLWSVVAAAAGIVARLRGTARWHLRAGHAYERLDRPEEASHAYERMLRASGWLPEWVHRLGDLYAESGDWDAVERVYRTALRQAPQEAEFHACLARSFDKRQRWDEAADAYRAAIERTPDDTELLLRLARVLEKRRRYPEAVEAYERALERAPGRVDVLELLAGARRQLPDVAGAVAAYERALEVGGAQAPPMTRLLLAALYDELGQWDLACRWLEENIEVHPEHAVSHRMLAKVAKQVYEWRGYFVAPIERPSDASFRWLDRVAASSPETERPEDYLARACRAMERAVDLGVDRTAWLAPLGQLREMAGYLPGAIEAYEASVAGAEESDRRWVLKSLNRWQYGLERAHHLAGDTRVEDPLFDSELSLVPLGIDDLDERPVGIFEADIAWSGLRVTGLVTAPDVETVELVLDDVVLRTLNVGGDGVFPAFGLGIRRPTLEHFPTKSRLTVRTSDGTELVAAGGGSGYDLSLPHGQGRILDILGSGGRLDKKGAISPTPEEARARQEDYLALYEEVRDFFDAQIGKPVFLLYGTLLGLVREGDFIPGDDDFDAGFISDEHHPRDVKRETKRIIVELVRAGFTVSFNRRGRLFRVQRDDIGGHDLHLDLRPVWFEKGKVWLHNYASYPSTVDDFLPVAEARLRDTRVYTPRRPEQFLELHYGPGWKVPDPGFAYHVDEMDPAIMAHLDRALITPAEYRALRDEIEADRRPGMGRFISIGSQSLYPVDQFMT
jgi:tetratricopeptide (TPR) repeat protein